MQNQRGGVIPRLLAVLVIGVVAACDRADSPVELGPEGLLERYVALGNSITASFQSDGIHREMQNQAYPVLLAGKAGASFGVPEFAMPGCPPPLAGPLTTDRIGASMCSGRVFPAPTLVQNLAVPGATVAHALDRTGTGSGLDLMILGNRSQVEAMLEARPTLVSVWLGNNDALRAALRADPGLLTPLAAFQASYDQVVDAIQSTDAQDAILIGVADAISLAPALQPGAYFWALARVPDLPFEMDVDESCAPFTPDGAPNPVGLDHMVSIQIVAEHLVSGAAGPVVIDCAADAPFVVGQADRQAIADRVAAFNDHIRSRAEENGWIYVDPGPSLLEPALADPDLVRKCQLMRDADDQASFLQAVATSCPSLDAPNFFGALFSYDGVHPSSAGHAVIADTLAARLNQRHGLNLPVP